MSTFKIAFRNIFRNRRRSLLTVLAIAVGAVAILLFGGFISTIFHGVETVTVQRIGHLAVYRKGYFSFGTGNQSAYGIARHGEVLELLKNDPELKPMLHVAAPTLALFGIAGNFAAERSRTFFGSGVEPWALERLAAWDPYRFRLHKGVKLAEDDPDGGFIGVGLARILGFCDELAIQNCEKADDAKSAEPADAEGRELADLAAGEKHVDAAASADKRQRIDLLAATASGAPNVVTLRVREAFSMGAKELDDAYVGMHIDLAQRLLYGRGERRATGIVIQLNATADMKRARERLERIFAERGLDLEVRDFTELQPQYGQVIALFGSIFTFLSIIMGTIVLFTVVNTMSMSVMERVNEIGTVRALGVRRSGIRRQFVAEGWVLGTIGATVGVVLAIVIAEIVNRSGLSWTPPTNASPVPLYVFLLGSPKLIAGAWIGLIVMATLAAFVPAMRAARMLVVDALRHV